MNQDLFHDATALLASPAQATQPNRRDWLKTAVGVGYAAACLPVMSQTAIRTSGDGLLHGEVMIDVNGFQMPAYRSMPQGKQACPVVLVVSEIFGVHEYIADVTRRLAHQGYLAIAPELMLRQGDPASYGEIGKLMTEVVAKVPDAQVMGDLDACFAWAGKHGGDATQLSVTGFCWGGRITWLYAAHQPAVRSAVAWYGRLVGQSSSLTPQHPLGLADQLKAPVLGLYAGADTGISLDSVTQMKQALASGNNAAKRSRIQVYDGVPHGFHADYRATYREAEANDGWQRMLQWMKAPA
jgi:carboxymethylenebutenolidase